jgi:hypothetical protein
VQMPTTLQADTRATDRSGGLQTLAHPTMLAGPRRRSFAFDRDALVRRGRPRCPEGLMTFVTPYC